MGGAETHVRNLANGLAERGHHVTLFSQPGEQRKLLSCRVDYHSANINDFNTSANTKRLEHIVRENDIHLAHGHQRLGIVLANKIARKTGILSLGTIHGQLKYDIRSTAVRRSLDHVISVRKSTNDEIDRCPVLRNKFTFILNGVPAYPRTGDEHVGTIMYGSRIDKRHGRLLLLLISEVLPELRKSIPEIRLLIYGAGDFKDQILEAGKVQNQKHDGLVKFKGFTSELGREYQGASLVIACARSAMDALVNGTCVLAASYHHLGEIITPDNFESFAQDNFESRGYPGPDAYSLRQKIAEFFLNKDRYQLGMQELRKKIQQSLTGDSSLNKTLEVYDSLVSKQ